MTPLSRDIPLPDYPWVDSGPDPHYYARMKTVKSTPEFTRLSEEEILKALDAYEALFDSTEEEGDEPDLAPEDPVVAEVARLIAAYTDRFDEYCSGTDEFPAEALEYEPEAPIEQISFEIFTDALHDALQEADDEEDE